MTTSPMNLNPILNALRQAAGLCKQVQRQHPTQRYKTAGDPVIIADDASQPFEVFQ